MAAIFLVTLTILLALPSGARERKTLQRSQTDPQRNSADFYLDRNSPQSNFGGSTLLQVEGNKRGDTKRSIVRFDFGEFKNPAIKTAILTLRVSTPPQQTLSLDAHRITSFYAENDASWSTRVASLRWSAAGGDFIHLPTASAVVGPHSVTASWDITSDVRAWFNGTPNYGTLIRNSADSGADSPLIFFSKEDPTESHRPELELTFVQNVERFRAQPADARINLSWAFHSPIGTVLEPVVGVIILRSTGRPVEEAAIPIDGTDPGLCARMGTSTVVFDDFTSATTFSDDSSDPCGGPTNDVYSFYRIFVRDTANNYSTNGSAGSFLSPETAATPSRFEPQAPLWIHGTHSAELSAPSLSPGRSVLIGSQSRLLFKFKSKAGDFSYPAVSFGESIANRSSVIDAEDSSTGRSVIFLVDSSGLAYAVDTDSGIPLWISNPTASETTRFGSGGAVWVRSFEGSGYSRSSDLFVVGTRDVNRPHANQILGIDGNTGQTVWQVVGNANSSPALDIISSSPWIDYAHNAIWVTSRSAGSSNQPSLWKLNPNTGSLLAALNLGDTDSSPSLTPDARVLFVGNNSGTVYAIDPVSNQIIASYKTSDGPIHGYPLVVNFASPFQVVTSGSSKVQMVAFDLASRTFSAKWTAHVVQPSAPIGFSDIGRVYVGAADGLIHELDITTGRELHTRIVDPQGGVAVGDPSLDVFLNQIYVTANDGRVYAFSYPF